MRFSLSCTSVVILCLGFSGVNAGSADPPPQAPSASTGMPGSAPAAGANGEKVKKNGSLTPVLPPGKAAYGTASEGPRGALFQENGDRGSPTAAWLLLGLYVVTCLLAGAACAHVAVGRGLPASRWFFAGLVFHFAALSLLILRVRGDGSHGTESLPSGLAKVPLTRSPRACPRCARPNHPAASRCHACGARLDPLVAPESARDGEAPR